MYFTLYLFIIKDPYFRTQFSVDEFMLHLQIFNYLNPIESISIMLYAKKLVHQFIYLLEFVYFQIYRQTMMHCGSCSSYMLPFFFFVKQFRHLSTDFGSVISCK